VRIKNHEKKELGWPNRRTEQSGRAQRSLSARENRSFTRKPILTTPGADGWAGTEICPAGKPNQEEIGALKKIRPAENQIKRRQLEQEPNSEASSWRWRPGMKTPAGKRRWGEIEEQQRPSTTAKGSLWLGDGRKPTLKTKTGEQMSTPAVNRKTNSNRPAWPGEIGARNHHKACHRSPLPWTEKQIPRPVRRNRGEKSLQRLPLVLWARKPSTDFEGKSKKTVTIILRLNYWKIIDFDFEVQLKNSWSSSLRVRYRSHTASPDIPIVWSSSTRPVWPSSIVYIRSPNPVMIFIAVWHAAPATCKRDSPNKTKIKVKQQKYPEFKFKTHQINDSSRLN
jgi:hypothetical protein